MSSKSKVKTIFELSIFKLWHVHNLIAVGVKTSGLRWRGAQCAYPRVVRGTKRPRPRRLNIRAAKLQRTRYFGEFNVPTVHKATLYAI